VARGSEEQSDSIDEIAGAANSLSSAAKRVAQLVGEFKLGNTPARGTPVDDYRLSGALSNRSGNARDSGWMRKAAGFVIAGVLAGAAYAAPGSPLPSLAKKVLGDDNVQVRPAARETTPGAVMVSGMSVATGNQMVIVFEARQASGQIRVTLSDDREIDVRATGTGASFTSGEQMLTVGNGSSVADFAIAIPRHARLVEIRIGQDRVFLKDGARIVTASQLQGADVWMIPLSPGR